MGKHVDLTGERFGRLTPIKAIRENGRFKWECICDCGGSTITTSSKLKSGRTNSCGCLQRERASAASKKDLSGKVFGRLTVVSRTSEIGEHAKYLCECVCGNTTIVEGSNLVSGATTSCGCYRQENAAKLKLSHGKCGSRIYRCWRNMIDRCTNPKNKEYKNYGGRGITICEDWKESFRKFHDWAISHGYAENLTIERKDVNKGYCPENCTWANMYTQARNRTDNRRISFNGETMILTDWARELNISESTIRERIKRGYRIEDVLHT